MLNRRLINTKVAGGGGGCTDIVDNYDPFGGSGVALYQLNGNATDVSGNYNGTASNVTYGTGQFGQAGVFNGSSSKITTSLTQTNTNAWSWSFWVNINAKPSAGSIAAILSNINGAAPFAGVTFLIDSPNFGIASNGSNIWTTNTINPSLSTWYHIVITYNGSGAITPYINGQSYGVISHTPSNGNTITLGDSDVSSWGSFNGSIDQVRIFNTALTPLEIESLYTEELCICDGTVDTLQVLGDTSCIATYQLDGNANDLSGNYSGTPTDVSYGVGEFDLAGVFNGTSSFIDTNAKIPASLDFSVSFWMKSSDTSSGSHFIFGTKGNYLTNGWFISNEAGYIRYGEGNGVDNATSQTSPSIVANGNWNHVVVTRAAGGTINMYVNNSRVVTDASVGTYFMISSNWAYDTHIGRYAASSILFYDGELDQVRIFNKALSAGEVTTLYNETACTYTPKDYITTNLALDFFSKDITAASTTWTDRANSNVLTKSGSTVYNDATGLVDFTGGYWANDSLTETLKDASGDFTLEFYGQANVANKIIASTLQSSTVRGFLLLQQPSEVEAINYQTGTNSNGQSINHPFQSGLNHIVIQFDNSSFQKFYLNGVLVNTNTLNLNNPFWTAPNGFRLGSDITLPSLSSSMNMGIFRVYKGLLSEQDIITNYNWAIRQF